VGLSISLNVLEKRKTLPILEFRLMIAQPKAQSQQTELSAQWKIEEASQGYLPCIACLFSKRAWTILIAC